LCFTVTLCFIGSKRASQGADGIAQVFGEVLVTHLVKVVASLFVWHDDKAKHFFTGQSRRVLWFLRCSSILPIDIIITCVLVLRKFPLGPPYP
jgi:hypothetical protein